MRGKPRSFEQSYALLWILFLGMGAVFLGVAVVMQLVPIAPENLNYSVNGVRQAATEQSVRTFRRIFLLGFGSIGLVMAGVGAGIAAHTAARRARARRLRESGIHLIARVDGAGASAMRVNYRRLLRLRCSYTDSTGTCYIFKSALLRENPLPYLPDGQVAVYHDPNDIRRYYVDVDGSVGVGSRVVEL